jgi:murein DD-endopeptidase MepM/ murein hydrolase activator NlpD
LNFHKPLDIIKQNPAHKKRTRRKKINDSRFNGFFGLLHKAAYLEAQGLGKPDFPKTYFHGVGKNRFQFRLRRFFFKPFTKKNTAFENPDAEGKHAPSPRTASSLRLSPVLTVLSASLLALFIYCSFSLNGSAGGVLITPPEDSGFQAEMASYAGLSGSPGLLFEAASPESGGALQSEDIPLDMTETFSWRSYTVKQGDSVSKIAAAYGISMDAIIASNGITNARRLSQGQIIRIPNMDGIPYTVKKGDSFLKISSAMKVPLAAILDANDIQSENISPGAVLFIPGAKMRTEDLKRALGEFFIYPIRGPMTSPYGWRNDPISGVRRFHGAIDMAAVIGTPVKAAIDGRVSTVGYNATYGRFIILSHSDGLQTMYAHLSAASVKEGAAVKQGVKIGEVGNTGYSTGPHLHFAVYKNGRAVDPRELLTR